MIAKSTPTHIPSLKGIKLTDEFIKRFHSKVVKSGPIPAHVPHLGECWSWTGVIENNGYGSICIKHTGFSAHRVSYEVNVGPIPDGMCVLHKCDRRVCTRPDHLFIGTKAENNHDTARKGRAASGDRNGKRLYPERILRGDAHPLRKNPMLATRGSDVTGSKLTEELVIGIRKVADLKKRNFSILGRQYGVSSATVRAIYHRHTWTHI